MSQSLTRGFLFADLRGYTSYLEKRGAVAGASLLGRFRAVVRSAVGRYGRAQIRTEGDRFHVVFPSASTAVACALDIVRESVAKSSGETSIPVGVGVHAGEALETNEGLVGTS